jgi:hypothetical protein
MGYLTLRIRRVTGDLLFESDFTLHELIPLVRHLTRSLGHDPDIAANPIGYRVFLTPCYGALPKVSAAATPWKITTSPSPPPPVGEGSLLQISEEDVEVLAPVSYLEELEAFYRPGTSGLCLSCPERLRCRGSGAAGATDLAGWIELDPEAPRSNQPVTYFQLRIETLGGRVLHASDVRLGKLQLFVSLVASLLRDAGRLDLPRDAGIRIEVIAHFEGQPQIDPLLLRAGRVQASPRSVAILAQPLPDPPRRLVDWDRLEEPEAQASPVPAPVADTAPAPDPVDLEITVFPTETDPLERRPPPASEPAPRSRPGPEHLPILLHRSVIGELDAQCRSLRSEAGGILIGEAFLDPANDRPYVEVVAALPARDEQGELMKVNFDSHFLRQIQERIDRDFPGRRTVGWYHFHLLRVAVRTTGAVVTAGFVGEPLSLHDEEVFLHRNFFPQPWHVGLVIDTIDGGLCFYHQRDGAMAVSGDCRLVG